MNMDLCAGPERGPVRGWEWRALNRAARLAQYGMCHRRGARSRSRFRAGRPAQTSCTNTLQKKTVKYRILSCVKQPFACQVKLSSLIFLLCLEQKLAEIKYHNILNTRLKRVLRWPYLLVFAVHRVLTPGTVIRSGECWVLSPAEWL